MTIGTKILKFKLKMRVKMKFFRLFTMFLVILRSFYITYVEMSCHLIVPLIRRLLSEPGHSCLAGKHVQVD